jgi:exopolyphosphatase/guanosine-5'-triphosphate,3'-diphosphate pyrophosphatase
LYLGFLIIASAMPRYAAIDIGSNSIRMMAAEVEPGQPFRVLAEDRLVTRLGESVFSTGSLSLEAIDVTCGQLESMTQAYRAHNPRAARIVATAAVRDASNSQEFLERASAIAGQPVELISGQEEARLIHLGVETRWPHPAEKILIVDVGGGSAEVIAAAQGRMIEGFSRPLGAVRLQSAFLKSDPPSPHELLRMSESIEEKLAVVVRRLGGMKFQRAIATSASASSIICAVNRIPRTRRDLADRRKATAAQIRRLYTQLSAMDLAQRRKVAGIGPRRAEIIVPGIAVLMHILERFHLPALAYCAAGVRDGVIRDLADRGAGRDRMRLDREQRRLVEEFARRFGVDLRHARRVASFALELFERLEPLHALPHPEGRLLEAAAYLRDVGHAISDASHHKHSHYIVANADLGGFTADERRRVAMLCRYHRKAMPGPRHPEFLALTPEDRRALLLLAPLLRVADALDRSREQRVEAIECLLRNGQVVVRLRAAADTGLEQWAAENAAAAFRLSYERNLVIEKAAP